MSKTMNSGSQAGTSASQLASRMPVSCTLRGRQVPCNGWLDLYQKLVQILVQDYPRKFDTALSLSGARMPDIGNDTYRKYMRQPVSVSNLLYLETGIPVVRAMSNIQRLLRHCEISPSDVAIRCSSKRASAPADAVAKAAPGQAPRASAGRPAMASSATERTVPEQDIVVRCTYGIEELSARSLPAMYHMLATRFEREWPQGFRGPFALSPARRADVGPAQGMRDPRPLGRQLLECGLTPNEIVENIGLLCDRCGIPRTQVRGLRVQRTGGTAPAGARMFADMARCKWGTQTLSAETWPDLYHMVAQRLERAHPEDFTRPFSLSGRRKVDVGAPEGMADPRRLNERMWLECGLAPVEVVENICLLRDRCGVPAHRLRLLDQWDEAPMPMSAPPQEAPAASGSGAAPSPAPDRKSVIVRCTYGSEELTARSLPSMYHMLAQRMRMDAPRSLRAPLSLSGRRVDLGPAEGMADPRRLNRQTYIECGISAAEILENIGLLCDRCGVPREKVSEIVAKGPDGRAISVLQLQADPEDRPRDMGPMGEDEPEEDLAEDAPEDAIPDALRIAAEAAIERMPRGRTRAESQEDAALFRETFQELTGAPLPEGVDLGELVREAGVTAGEWTYAVSAKARQEAADLAGSELARDARVLTCAGLFRKRQEQLEALGIPSPEVLEGVLRRELADRHRGHGVFSSAPSVTLRSEVSAQFGPRTPLRTLDELAAALECVPEEDIEAVLKKSGLFERVSSGAYVLSSQVRLSEEDVAEAEEMVEDGIRRNGFAPFRNLRVDRSAALNPDLDQAALRRILFQQRLADRYERRGGRGAAMVPKGAEYKPIRETLRDYCRSHDHVLLPELVSCEAEHGAVSENRALLVACEEMVRVGREEFVSPGCIQFRMASTEHAILFQMGRGTVAPVQALAKSGALPALEGFSWNAYLLQSFLKASKRLVYLGPGDGTNPAGAVCRRAAAPGSYKEALARAAVESGLAVLDEDHVSAFLRDAGYVTGNGTVKAICEEAERIRQGMARGVGKNSRRRRHPADPGQLPSS